MPILGELTAMPIIPFFAILKALGEGLLMCFAIPILRFMTMSSDLQPSLRRQRTTARDVMKMHQSSSDLK